MLPTRAPNSFLFVSRICPAPGNTLPSPSPNSEKTSSKMASASTRLRFVAGLRFTSQTCCSFPTLPAFGWIRLRNNQRSVLIGSAVDPITKEGYAFDPRSVAQRAESYLKFTGLADTAYFGPEAEFFVFDSVKFHNEQHSAGFAIDSDEAHWNSGRDANEFAGSNLGYRIRPKEGYVPVPPTDSLIRLAIRDLADAGASVASLSNVIITKSQPPVSVKSTSAIPRCWERPIIFKYSNT